MIDGLLAKSASELGVFGVILALFGWLLVWNMKEDRRREEAHFQREEILIQHNAQFAATLGEITRVVKEQGDNLKQLSKELSSLTAMVDRLRSQFDEMRNDVKDEIGKLWSSIPVLKSRE